LIPSHEKKKGGEKMLKTIKKPKNKVACNAALGPAVVLSAPRSAFLAEFQPARASESPPGLKSKKTSN
jgi:hypothetical protein